MSASHFSYRSPPISPVVHRPFPSPPFLCHSRLIPLPIHSVRDEKVTREERDERKEARWRMNDRPLHVFAGHSPSRYISLISLPCSTRHSVSRYATGRVMTGYERDNSRKPPNLPHSPHPRPPRSGSFTPFIGPFLRRSRSLRSLPLRGARMVRRIRSQVPEFYRRVLSSHSHPSSSQLLPVASLGGCDEWTKDTRNRRQTEPRNQRDEEPLASPSLLMSPRVPSLSLRSLFGTRHEGDM